jgi:hypothetical protein
VSHHFVVDHISWNCRFFNRSFLPKAGWISLIPDYPIRKGNPASDVSRRTIAAGHHPVMVTLIGEECDWPVLPSTRFSWPHFPLPILVQRMGDLGEQGAVFDRFQQFQRGERLDAVRRGLPSGLSRCATTRMGTSCGG